ncbi:MAG: glycosyltransferase family 4 protein [Proteobacteria bacterium]|nr:MAG: glycosyltransferase family 4 protein [Pseudomonadota bacterium]
MITPITVGIVAGVLANLLYVRTARHFQIFDIPNARSSHTAITPRGGGLVFVIVITIYSLLNDKTNFALLLGSLMVAGIGYLDDLKGVSAKNRFGVHSLAALGFCATQWIAPSTPLMGTGVLVALFLIIYSVNTFNFIDGINGILGSVCLTGVVWILLAQTKYSANGLTQLLILLAILLSVFLVFNWTPAKLFMGDVGSGYLGFFIPVISIIIFGCSLESILSLTILFLPIYVDCAVTLIQRLIRHENIFEAHRSHFYQRLSHRWNSHSKVSILYAGYTALIAGPVFYWTIRYNLNLTERLVGIVVVSAPIAFACSFVSRKT